MSAEKNEFKIRMEKLLGAESSLFFESVAKIAKSNRKSLRVNPTSTLSVAQLREAGFKILEQVPWCENGWFFDRETSPDLSKHPYVLSGAVFVQEAGAMEPVEILAPKPGETVLDLCAAPGAKSTQIIEKLAGRGWLVANDPHRERAKTLDTLLCRHGAVNSTAYNLEPHRLEEYFSGVFDAVLVDAPCSGESLFAKRSEHRADVKDSEIERCATRQSEILSSAAKMSKSGGRILYSTCAYASEENEAVVEEFLKEHTDFKLMHESRRYPHRDGVPGGYCALLVRYSETPSEAIALGDAIRKAGTNGLIRNGKTRWDGEEDVFVSFMNREMESSIPLLDVSLAELKAILAESYTTDLSQKIRRLSPEKNSFLGIRALGEKIGLVRVETNRIRTLILS